MIYLINTLSFLLVILILVAVHEFGHFYVARQLGVKVLRFSIGFGAKIWESKPDSKGTQYQICAIPLGGYVKMLDESEGEVAQDQQSFAFNRKPVQHRIAIVAAGPVINLLFAVMVYWLLFVMGVEGLRPIVGAVVEGTPAALAGFRLKDQIVSVDGEPVVSWEQVTDRLLAAIVDQEKIKIGIETEEKFPHTRILDFTQIEGALDEPGQLFKLIGFSQWFPEVHPIVMEVLDNSAAALAKIAPQDQILQIAGQEIRSSSQLIELVRRKPGIEMQFRILRNGETLDVLVTPQSVVTETGRVGQIGASIGIPPSAFDALRVNVQYSLLDGFFKGWEKTTDASVLLLKVLKKMIMGEASLKNISGPVTIAEFAGKSTQLGFGYFLNLLAMLSLTLGVFNLLPIPILDGGHIFYYAIEAIKGSPLSENVMITGQWVGMLALAFIMSLAFYNDYMRIFG